MAKAVTKIVVGSLLLAICGLVAYGASTGAVDVPGRGRGFAAIIGAWALLGMALLRGGLSELPHRGPARDPDAEPVGWELFANRVGCLLILGILAGVAWALYQYQPVAAMLLGGALILCLAAIFLAGKGTFQEGESGQKTPPEDA